MVNSHEIPVKPKQSVAFETPQDLAAPFTAFSGDWRTSFGRRSRPLPSVEENTTLRDVATWVFAKGGRFTYTFTSFSGSLPEKCL